MNNLLKKRKPLFDGEDSNFYRFSVALDLPGGGQLIFDNQRTHYLSELGEPADALMSLLERAEKRVDSVAGFASYRQGNLALHYQQTADTRSGAGYLIVVAAGELQPARYAIYLAGVFAWP